MRPYAKSALKTGIWFAVVHDVLVVFAFLVVAHELGAGRDTEFTLLPWTPFVYIDWPVATLLGKFVVPSRLTNGAYAIMFGTAGALQWFVIGFVAVIAWHSMKGRLRRREILAH